MGGFFISFYFKGEGDELDIINILVGLEMAINESLFGAGVSAAEKILQRGGK